MNIVNEFPYPIREIENCWIPLSDGIRLAARIWLPQQAEAGPCGADSGTFAVIDSNQDGSAVLA